MPDDRDDDDDALTPVAAPEAKKRFPMRRTSSSSMAAVDPKGDHECPKCSGGPIPCTLCKGKRKVSLSVVTAYLLNGEEPAPDTDPVPPTERNDK